MPVATWLLRSARWRTNILHSNPARILLTVFSTLLQDITSPSVDANVEWSDSSTVLQRRTQWNGSSRSMMVLFWTPRNKWQSSQNNSNSCENISHQLRFNKKQNTKSCWIPFEDCFRTFRCTNSLPKQALAYILFGFFLFADWSPRKSEVAGRD